MPRKNPYLNPSKVKDTPEKRQNGVNAGAMQAAIQAAGVAPGSPSYAQATSQPVDASRYTAREKSVATMALDRSAIAANSLSFVESTGFPGFPTLALLGQLSEYRSMHERFADECVRAWGKVISRGAATDDKLAQIESELERINLRTLVRTLVFQEQAFGRAHACFNLQDDKAYLTTPLVLLPSTVRKGGFLGMNSVEAYWVSPNNYNSIDPSKDDFYKPSSWWMLGQEIHATRLWTLVSRPVADMLKPAYSFAGVSMTQLAMPYIDNWLRTRQSVSDTVKQFSVSGIGMDLSQWLAPGGAASLQQRAQLINAYRDNRNLLLLDKSTEEFFQINTPLSGLSELQAQAQEQQSSVSHIPLVILLGITPNGLNASSDGEIRVFYDYVLGYLNAHVLALIQYVLKIVQLSLFGEIDETIGWKWFPLYQPTRQEQAEIDAKNASTDATYVEIGAVSNDQVAARLAADPDSRYAGINEDIDDLDDTDIEGITEHILEMEPAPPKPPISGGQAGSSSNEPSDDLNAQASAISTPHSPDKPDNDPTRRRNKRRNMGV
jgi:uncharacterized protein